MKTLRSLFLVAVLGCLPVLFAFTVYGQTNDVPGTPAVTTPAAVSIFEAFIPFLTPIVIAMVKLLLPRIPKPIIPWIAPLLGAAASWIANLSGFTQGNVLLGAVLGAAGVGVREAVDQLRKQWTASTNNATNWLLLLAPLVLLGCRSLDPNGIYAGDKILYTAERTTRGAYDTLNAFVSWELENRAALADRPEITQAADAIRRNARQWIDDAIAMRDAYAANPRLEQNRSNLERALVTLRQALATAQKYLPGKKSAGCEPLRQRDTTASLCLASVPFRSAGFAI